MISDLIVNISLLMSFTFIWHQMFRNTPLTHSSKFTVKLTDGIIAGFLGIILMHYSIQVNDITILDLRHIPVILVALYGGYLSAIISAIVISVGRFFIDVNFSSFVSLFMMLAIALGSGAIVHLIKASEWKKWTILLIYSQFIFSLALYIVVENYSQVLNFAFNHIISTLVGGYLTFYFVRYIRRNSELYYQYKKRSQRDSLTGLYNVRSFDYFYNKMLEKSIEEKQNCSFCLIDVDHFKRINDTYGHSAGDEVLKQLSELLLGLTRDEDKLSRNGGEEFSILLPNCTLKQAEEIATRVRTAVEVHQFQLSDQKIVKLTVSLGLATYKGDINIHDQDDLFQAADRALYKAKQSGRNIACTKSICFI